MLIAMKIQLITNYIILRFSILDMGFCSSKPKEDVIADSPEELYIQANEARLGLSEINFKDYQFAIKKFGYRIDLNREHMRAIAAEIKLNYDELTDRESAQGAVYRDEKAFYREGRYNVQNMLKLGFLLCKHDSPAQQESDLWMLVNPDLNRAVERQVLR